MTRILIIEDEPMLRQEVMDWLTFEGYDGVGAEDGIAGLNAALHTSPDLIVCDITMPKLDGYGVLLELRANPVTAAIPFIFVTARASHDDVRRGMASGADDYITKPFTRMELFEAIQSRLEKKSAQKLDREREIRQLQQALTEAQEERLLKTQLVSMFWHDFRNSLAGIISSNTLLREYADRMDEKRRQIHLSRIDASARQLMQMLDDMLLVTQMEAGDFEFRPVLLNAEVLFQHVIEEFQAIYGETHHIVFESHYSNHAAIDPRLLRPIVTNLISNAIKYSPEGSEIRVTLGLTNNRVTFSIHDQGPIIPEDVQAHLFDVASLCATGNEVSSADLGLTVVKRAATLHGGSVSVESQAGLGTTITVTIPLLRHP